MMCGLLHIYEACNALVYSAVVLPDIQQVDETVYMLPQPIARTWSVYKG